MKSAPRTDRAARCVEMMRAGAHFCAAAEAGIKPQSAEKLYYRWVIYPEVLLLRAEVQSLSRELLDARRTTKGA